ncbi:MAG: glycosyltransferase family 4 protein [Myxococcota bacterium]|nr:glycosyltransferase family 4 protein [Myxococcota bacterium]
MSPLRILLVGPLPGPIGGVGRSFQQLVDELRARDDVRIHVVDTFRGESGLGLGDAWLALRVAWHSLRAARDSDVVTFHASSRATVLFGPLIRGIARLTGRPFLLREFGGSFDSDLAGMHPIAQRLGRSCLRGEGVLLQTQALVAHFREAVPEACIRWFPTSRPRPEALPPRTPREGGARRFAFASHVKASKGIHEILEASRSLPPDCSVDVYGPFREGMDESVFEGQERVVYHGPLSADAVQPMLAEHDVLLLPTYHFGEGYPGILLEAYSVGIPVIASRWRAIPEIVEDGVSGLLVEPRDAEGLAQAMSRVVGDDAFYQRLCKGASALSDRFLSGRWTDAFVEHCRALAEGRELPRPEDRP